MLIIKSELKLAFEMNKYNCLTINNEIWLLEARVAYDQWFDYIILAEASTTHSGIFK